MAIARPLDNDTAGNARDSGGGTFSQMATKLMQSTLGGWLSRVGADEWGWGGGCLQAGGLRGTKEEA